jgi:protein-S-isoprenylcysteine O-methyltransferase Ste14
MIWARIIFGLRSFHVTANTTKGELVTTGPYRWLRHPIYAAIMYFAFAAIISYPFIDAIAAFMLISAGLLFRIVLEEKELLKTYDNYAEYSKHAKRIIPFIY